MKVAKIIPKTIPILILRHEKPKILSKIGQNVPYLVVLDGYTHTLGGVYYIHLTMQAYSVTVYFSIFSGLDYEQIVNIRVFIGKLQKNSGNFLVDML